MMRYTGRDYGLTLPSMVMISCAGAVVAAADSVVPAVNPWGVLIVEGE